MGFLGMMDLLRFLRGLFSKVLGIPNTSSPQYPPSITDSTIDLHFSSAARIGCWITSCPDGVYNCIAWAAGDTNNWWWPDAAGHHWWPPGTPRELTLSAFIKAFGTVGYREWKNENASLENGYEKVSIYVDQQGNPTHAARQLEGGLWASKLGRHKDVQHATISAIEGGDYGSVVKILRRPRQRAPQSPRPFPACAKTCQAICGGAFSQRVP
jgi:hypothetical protein